MYLVIYILKVRWTEQVMGYPFILALKNKQTTIKDHPAILLYCQS